MPEASIPQGTPEFEVRPLGRDMVLAFLKKDDLRFLTDEVGDFLLIFEGDAKQEIPELNVWLTVASQPTPVYSIRASAPAPPGPSFSEWCHITNAYCAQKRWPSVYVQNEKSGLRLHLEQHFNLGAGVHQELLDSLTRSTFASIWNFFIWWHDQKDDLKGEASGEDT